MTTVYYAQILKSDNKWYYVKNSPFFLTEESALICARVAAGKNDKSIFRAISREVELDENGAISC